jgi:hypothetical protein
LIILGLLRLQLEIVCLVVASLATVTAWRSNPLVALSLLLGSIMKLGRFRARFTLLWLLLLDPRFLRADLRAVLSDVIDDAAVMIGRQVSFVGMFHDRLCKFNVSILTHNNVET